ncbi:MAG: YciI family protein [Solirubrobacteraceae bacterium]
MRYLAVTRSRGAAWDPSLDLDEQASFAEHAAYMNALVAEGFVVLGGPLDDEASTLLIVDAPDEQAVRARLAGDPWTAMGLLELSAVAEWEILLGG